MKDDPMAHCQRRDLTEDIAKLPKWFRENATAGFQFYDPDGDIVMVIGQGGWRDPNYNHRRNAYDLEFKPWTLVGAFLYKGEWHLCDLLDKLEKPAEWWRDSRPRFPLLNS
jgi:hypothetical protein